MTRNHSGNERQRASINAISDGELKAAAYRQARALYDSCVRHAAAGRARPLKALGTPILLTLVALLMVGCGQENARPMTPASGTTPGFDPAAPGADPSTTDTPKTPTPNTTPGVPNNDSRGSAMPGPQGTHDGSQVPNHAPNEVPDGGPGAPGDGAHGAPVGGIH